MGGVMELEQEGRRRCTADASADHGHARAGWLAITYTGKYQGYVYAVH
jgi:hypothetical protein